jgi:hypothetical protein
MTETVHSRNLFTVVIVALVVASACAVTVSERGIAGLPGEEVWKTDIDLELGQTAYVQEANLQITLEAAGPDSATVQVRDDRGFDETRTLRVGGITDMRVRGFTVRILSAREGAAEIQVRQEWGPAGVR